MLLPTMQRMARITLGTDDSERLRNLDVHSHSTPESNSGYPMRGGRYWTNSLAPRSSVTLPK